MNFAVVALLLSSPVVKLGPGSGVVIGDGVLVTTARVARDTPRPEGRSEDGGTVKLLQTREIAEGLALVAFEGDAEVAELEKGLPDAGALVVVTADGVFDATLTAASGTRLELAVADAGAVEGAALMDSTGHLWGVMHDGHTAVTADAAREAIDALMSPGKRRADPRWRNLGISAAFFLGLSVWWVYRFKRRRY